MPPKGWKKLATVDDSPQLLTAALLVVRALRDRDPQSMYLAMAESGLEQQERLTTPSASTDTGGQS